MVHAFSVELATDYGVNCAILLGHFWYWTKKNMESKKHFHDGRYWTYNTQDAYAKLYQWNKEHGICVDCAANWAEPGHVTCKACRIKAMHSRLKYDTSLGEKKRPHNRREEYISKGLCKDCGKPTVEGLKVCKKCRDRRRESALIYRIRQKIQREALT